MILIRFNFITETIVTKTTQNNMQRPTKLQNKFFN